MKHAVSKTNPEKQQINRASIKIIKCGNVQANQSRDHHITAIHTVTALTPPSQLLHHNAYSTAL